MKIIENNLDRAYRLYVVWQSEPPSERAPKTLKEFIEKHEITKADLAEFEKAPGYYEDLERQATKWGRSKLPELLHLLYRQILSRKKASDIEVFKKLITRDANAPQGNTINIFNLDAKQHKQILEREARAAGLLTTSRKG